MPTTAPTHQKTPATPTAAPASPNSIGIATLEALITMSRNASASPCRCSGVIWCIMLITMGCTVPSARPSSTEHRPIASAECISG